MRKKRWQHNINIRTKFLKRAREGISIGNGRFSDLGRLLLLPGVDDWEEVTSIGAEVKITSLITEIGEEV